MISRDGEFFLKHVLPVALVICVIAMLVIVFSMTVGAKRRFRECAARNGYTIECLSEYEMERLQW